MYVLIVINNDGGFPATLHETLDGAARAALDALTTLDDGPPLTDEEARRMQSDLADLDDSMVNTIRGSDAWKEWAHIAPVADGAG